MQLGEATEVRLQFYDYGPRDSSPPLLCVHGLVGGPENFYKQIVALASRSVRVIAVEIPVLWTVGDFVRLVSCKTKARVASLTRTWSIFLSFDF